MSSVLLAYPFGSRASERAPVRLSAGIAPEAARLMLPSAAGLHFSSLLCSFACCRAGSAAATGTIAFLVSNFNFARPNKTEGSRRWQGGGRACNNAPDDRRRRLGRPKSRVASPKSSPRNATPAVLPLPTGRMRTARPLACGASFSQCADSAAAGAMRTSPKVRWASSLPLQRCGSVADPISNAPLRSTYQTTQRPLINLNLKPSKR